MATGCSAASPPRLSAFVGDVPSSDRLLVLLELIKTDLEMRWQDRRAPALLEDYLAEFPELGRKEQLPEDLINRIRNAGSRIGICPPRRLSTSGS